MLAAALLPVMAQADQGAQTPSQTYVSGEIVKAGQLPAGYNASATYQCMDGWDIFITGDYIYWNWKQNSLKRGEYVLTSTTTSGTQTPIYLSPGYASGFQVGMGFNMHGMDDWNLCADYTWYKNSDNITASNDSTHVMRFLKPDTGTPIYRNGSASIDASMNFNEFGLYLKRPFYFGKKLSANFATGLDALWITQSLDISSSGHVGNSPFNTTTPDNSIINYNTKAWSLGPKVGLDTNWMLGYGLSILANASASLLYTSYYDLSVVKTITQTANRFTVTVTDPNNFNTLRPIMKMFLGLGWNTGLCDNSFRLGFSAGYDFAVFWNYDMMNFSTIYTNAASGNMYLQGLNIQARFDF